MPPPIKKLSEGGNNIITSCEIWVNFAQIFIALQGDVNMKRSYKFFAGIALFALLLAGCNNSDGNNSGGGSSDARRADMYTVFEMDSKLYIYFGSYPQSVVSDPSLKTELSKITTTNSKGYYEYGGSEYAKKNVNAGSYLYKYADGTQVTNNTTEFFKVEPILWRILTSDSSGNCILLAEQAINTHRYDSSSNNYMNSEIRTWLNDDFYNSAFKSTEKGAILTTTVDNSAATTNSISNPYACDNTSDKVYLLSYKDYLTSYGFSTSNARYCEPTDYAIANGSFMYMDERNCNYWTRSPDSDASNCGWTVSYDGDLRYDIINDEYGVGGSSVSVRPSLSINIA